MTAIIALFARWGAGTRLSRILAWVVAGIAAIALLWLLGLIFGAFDWWDDRQAVQADRATGNADFRERQLEAERDAGAAKEARDSAEAAKQEQLKDLVDEAQSNGGSAADDVWDNGLWD